MLFSGRGFGGSAGIGVARAGRDRQAAGEVIENDIPWLEVADRDCRYLVGDHWFEVSW